MIHVAIIGATMWGNTLGMLLAHRGASVRVWTRTEAEAQELSQGQRNNHLPSTDSINYLYFTSDAAEALQEADLAIWAVPSSSLRQNVRQVRDCLTTSMMLVSGAKGLEVDNGQRMSEVMKEEISPDLWKHVCVLSGPNLSREIAQGLPAASVVAAQDIEVAKKAQGMFDSPEFCVFASSDVIGVEYCGAFKNIIALGAGMMDGLDLGDNAKAAFITLGWAEATSLGVASGADTATFQGLAGLGDLIATCASPLSRNHHVGFQIAKGYSLAEAVKSISQVAEGINTTMTAYRLAQKLGLEVPTIEFMHRALFESLSPAELAAQFQKSLRLKSTA